VLAISIFPLIYSLTTSFLKATDPRCRDTQRGNGRTTHGLKGQVASRKFYVDGFGNFHLSNGILLSDPYPYF
jgi:hypothetical protein